MFNPGVSAAAMETPPVWRDTKRGIIGAPGAGKTLAAKLLPKYEHHEKVSGGAENVFSVVPGGGTRSPVGAGFSSPGGRSPLQSPPNTQRSRTFGGSGRSPAEFVSKDVDLGLVSGKVEDPDDKTYRAGGLGDPGRFNLPVTESHEHDGAHDPSILHGKTLFTRIRPC